MTWKCPKSIFDQFCNCNKFLSNLESQGFSGTGCYCFLERCPKMPSWLLAENNGWKNQIPRYFSGWKSYNKVADKKVHNIKKKTSLQWVQNTVNILFNPNCFRQYSCSKGRVTQYFFEHPNPASQQRHHWKSFEDMLLKIKRFEMAIPEFCLSDNHLLPEFLALLKWRVDDSLLRQMVFKLGEPCVNSCMRGNFWKSVAWFCSVHWRLNHSVQRVLVPL